MYTGRPSYGEVSKSLSERLPLRRNYLVRFVVVLRVVFEDLGLLFVVKAPDEVVNAELLSPFLAFYEPGKP